MYYYVCPPTHNYCYYYSAAFITTFRALTCHKHGDIIRYGHSAIQSGAKFAQSNVHYRPTLSDYILTYIVGDDLAT